MEESSISSNGLVHGYGDHYTHSGDYMENYQMSEHFWNSLTKEEPKATYYTYKEVDVEAGLDVCLCNDFKNTIVHEEAEIQDDDSGCNDSNGLLADGETGDDEVTSYIDLTVVESNVGESDDCPDNDDDYESIFEKATRKGDWDVMEEIGTAHTETLTMKVFHNKGTALHHTLWYGEDRVGIAENLVNLMTPEGLETRDKDGYTPFALAVLLHHGNDLLSCMIERNEDLLKIGETDKIPVVVASWKGFRDTTEFLYPLTQKEILSPGYENPHDLNSSQDRVLGRVGINLLNYCISLNLYDIAEGFLESSPAFLRKKDDFGIYPTLALAKAMAALQISNIRHKKSSGWNDMLSNFGDCIMNCWCYFPLGNQNPSFDDRESIRCEAYKILQLIIRVKDFDIDIDHSEYIVDAMIEAAKHGIIEFIIEMLKVDRELIGINKDGKNMFWHAIMNRQEKVFNLIYAFDQKKDMLLSFYLDDKGNPPKDEESMARNPNILHFAAELPPSLELDRISGPDLQMQREVQWFKAVQDVTKPRYREGLNKSDLTPYVLFMKTHKKLLEEGEKSMKKTAIAASTVSGLIVTTMFAAALAVISGTYEIHDSSLSHDLNGFFIIFLIFATLSLCSCTASIIVFLGILASRYSPEDFLTSLPRKFMNGFWLLFVSITTMMLAFCCALYIMLKGEMLHLVVIPIFFFSLLPIVVFFRYICPLLRKICRSTNKPIFDKSTRLPKAL